mmetsp:Transcript_24434/g.67899  ORF Transcript_24434/g.67899 Transcript_24434/m.67899 type:complete len:1358 (+) Transcript_24434:145-4218(+)|eukprot:CAMPEP_0117675322 /NCGR_PEP_ID=MMETSP0804-20121206/15540_1 /TAXON_ID=1074897 /ORGANISM="Tetraselmis astigmatica, Strain CCMP880" /LENGTH=1357 /DNA_ID=CAMNT_0005484311 /DNA_START=84 /DNA_END=4157 /DNA_ORIENTATION=+
MGHPQPDASPMGNFTPVICNHAWWKPRVLFICFLSLLVLRAAEECTTAPAMVSPLELDVEMRMETVAHIAAIMAQQMSCKPSPGTPCLSDKKLLQKFMVLQDWASTDEGWDRLFSAYLLFHDAVQSLGDNRSSFAVASLEQAVAFKVFPYSDTKLLEHWQRALAMPGKLFRKQRLDLADVLMLAADSRLEMGQVTDDLSSLEEALKSLELSLALREAEDDPEVSVVSDGYAQSLRDGIIHAVNDIVPKLKVKELQSMLADRGVSCTGCIEKVDLMKKLVPALRLPIKLAVGRRDVLEDKEAPRVWIARQDGEDHVAFLHRILTSIVTSLGSTVLQEADAQCTAPSRSGCLSFNPAWGSITAPLQQQNSTKCHHSQHAGVGSPPDSGKPEGVRTWRLLDQLRIPGTGTAKPTAKADATAASTKPQAAGCSKSCQGKCQAGMCQGTCWSPDGCHNATEEALTRQVVEPGHLLPPLGHRSTSGSSKGICHQIGAHSGCEDGSCVDICSLLDNMLALEVQDLGSLMTILHRGRPLQAVADSLPGMSRSQHENNWSGSSAQQPNAQQPASDGGFAVDPVGRDTMGPGGHPHMASFGGFGVSSDETFRSERDRKLQEHLNRRSKDGAGQYRDDPMVPLTLCGCVIAVAAMYLGRKHRRSLSRVMSSWIFARGTTSAASASSLGTSISKERQAAAAALRAALARPEISIAELARCLEAAEATDVEGPLVRRGNQTMAQRRRRERDLAEAARSKAKAAKDREMARAKKEEQARNREAAAAASASAAPPHASPPAGMGRVKSSPLASEVRESRSSSESSGKIQRSKSDSRRAVKQQQQPSQEPALSDIPGGQVATEPWLMKGQSSPVLSPAVDKSATRASSDWSALSVSDSASSQELLTNRVLDQPRTKGHSPDANQQQLSPKASSLRSKGASAANSDAGEEPLPFASAFPQTLQRPAVSASHSPCADFPAPSHRQQAVLRLSPASPPAQAPAPAAAAPLGQPREPAPPASRPAPAPQKHLQAPAPAARGPAEVPVSRRPAPTGIKQRQPQATAVPSRPETGAPRQKQPIAGAAAAVAPPTTERNAASRPQGIKWNQVAALNVAATAAKPSPPPVTVSGTQRPPDPRVSVAPPVATAPHGQRVQQQQPGFPGMQQNLGLMGLPNPGLPPPRVSQPQSQLHDMGGLLHRPLPMQGSPEYMQPRGRYSGDPGLDYLNTLSQQQLSNPAGLSSQQLGQSSSGSMMFPESSALGLSVEGRGLFPSTLAAIWGDGPEPSPANGFGTATLPSAPTVPSVPGEGPGYQPFGSSSIWGSTASPSSGSGGLAALNDMSFLGSLGWSLQADGATAPLPAAAATNLDGSSHRDSHAS